VSKLYAASHQADRFPTQNESSPLSEGLEIPFVAGLQELAQNFFEFAALVPPSLLLFFAIVAM